MVKRKTEKTSVEFDPRVELSLEKTLVGLDYAVLSSLLNDNPDALRNGLSRLESMIREHTATGALDLCTARCDRGALLRLLHPFSREPIFKDARWSNNVGPGSTEAFLGVTSKELKELTGSIDPSCPWLFDNHGLGSKEPEKYPGG